MSAHRFEIVRTKADHHARFVASNGKIMFSSENYNRKARRGRCGRADLFRARPHISVR